MQGGLDRNGHRSWSKRALCGAPSKRVLTLNAAWARRAGTSRELSCLPRAAGSWSWVRPVAGNVDDVVRPAHDVQVAGAVPEPGVPSGVVPRELIQIGRLEPRIVVVQGGHESGRERHLDGDRAHLAVWDFEPALRVEHLCDMIPIRGRSGPFKNANRAHLNNNPS